MIRERIITTLPFPLPMVVVVATRARVVVLTTTAMISFFLLSLLGFRTRWW